MSACNQETHVSSEAQEVIEESTQNDQDTTTNITQEKSCSTSGSNCNLPTVADQSTSQALQSLKNLVDQGSQSLEIPEELNQSANTSDKVASNLPTGDFSATQKSTDLSSFSTFGMRYPRSLNYFMKYSGHRYASEYRPYRCETCGRQFTTSAYLSQHRRIHSGIKPYSCRFCKRRFTQLSHVQQHERIHTGEKPYGCSTCFKTFAQMSNLQSHQRQHMKTMPFKCNQCFMSYTNAEDLESHIDLKHVVNKYAKMLCCPICSKVYNSETYLSKHIDRHKQQGHTQPWPYHFPRRFDRQQHQQQSDLRYNTFVPTRCLDPLTRLGGAIHDQRLSEDAKYTLLAQQHSLLADQTKCHELVQAIAPVGLGLPQLVNPLTIRNRRPLSVPQSLPDVLSPVSVLKRKLQAMSEASASKICRLSQEPLQGLMQLSQLEQLHDQQTQNTTANSNNDISMAAAAELAASLRIDALIDAAGKLSANGGFGENCLKPTPQRLPLRILECEIPTSLESENCKTATSTDDGVQTPPSSTNDSSTHECSKDTDNNKGSAELNIMDKCIEMAFCEVEEQEKKDEKKECGPSGSAFNYAAGGCLSNYVGLQSGINRNHRNLTDIDLLQRISGLSKNYIASAGVSDYLNLPQSYSSSGYKMQRSPPPLHRGSQQVLLNRSQNVDLVTNLPKLTSAFRVSRG